MFSKPEIKLLYKSVCQTLENLNQRRFEQDTTDQDRPDLDQQLIQYLGVKQKLINQAPPLTLDNISLTRFTPVLVVDDSLMDRDICSTLLKAVGFSKILEAKEGQEALAIMADYQKSGMPVGLVLCDWNMPNMSGIEFINVIRRDKNLWNTPVYLVTANHDKAHIITAVKSGVTGYIVKPVSHQGLNDKLAPYLPETKKEEVQQEKNS